MTIRKTLCFFIIVSSAFFCVSAQKADNKQDTSALFILGKMSETLQNLSSCSFKASISYDIQNDDLGLVKHGSEEVMYMQSPDKFMMTTDGDKGKTYLVCNGKKLSYYSFLKNQYAEKEISGTVISIMDAMHSEFGIEFPAADFFYPTFVNDIYETGGTLLNLGITKVFGEECFHIAGRDTEGTSFQFWIADNIYFTPMRIVINYSPNAGNLQFEAYYTDWEINKPLPSSIFEFTAPPRAMKIDFVK